MKRLAELNALNLDATAHTRVAALVQSLIEEAQFKELRLQQAQQEAKAKDLKIQALTLELATLRRIRYGVKSEALSREQLDQPVMKIWLRSKQRWSYWQNLPPSPNANARVASRYPHTCHASNTAMNPNPANAGNAAQSGSKSAKTSPSNWMSNLPSSLCIDISVLNTPAAAAKP